MRHTAIYPITDLAILKKQLLAWTRDFTTAVYLDSNAYHPEQVGAGYECLVAVGAQDVCQAQAGQGAFRQLKQFVEAKNDWLFGFLGYDLKNEVENLHSQNPDGIGFPDLFFFQPQIVCAIKADQLHVFSQNPDTAHCYQTITDMVWAPNDQPLTQGGAKFEARYSKAEYLETVAQIRRDIIEGDLYEMNLCQEFYAADSTIDPIHTFSRLNALGKAPFSTFVRCHDRYLCCASPERFLKKTGDRLFSQPIKGTRRRGKDAQEDALIAASLSHSEKDCAENVMIVDLVRNDLARNCRPGSVQVDELFGIYPFETVFQMISTVSGRLRKGVHGVDALRDAFPPGSMTGAPKVMAMERIEQYERSRRGLFSGVVGYWTPTGDFDFNVVIRSLLYNAESQYLAYQVGGAIVFDSEAEQEYEECLLKAQGMLRALGVV